MVRLVHNNRVVPPTTSLPQIMQTRSGKLMCLVIVVRRYCRPPVIVFYRYSVDPVIVLYMRQSMRKGGCRDILRDYIIAMMHDHFDQLS